MRMRGERERSEEATIATTSEERKSHETLSTATFALEPKLDFRERILRGLPTCAP